MGKHLGRFSDRVFNGVEVRFLEIRGSGITGKWLFEIRALEQIGGQQKRSRFLVEFLPKQFRHSRLGLVGQGSGIGYDELTGLLDVPEELQQAFDRHIRSECERRNIKLRRTRQGPAYMIRQLTTLLINSKIKPSKPVERAVREVIERNLESPVFIRQVNGTANQFHFGDEYIGRFFMQETPAY